MQVYYRLLAASFACLIVACAAIPTTSSVNPWQYPNRSFSVSWGAADQKRFITSLRPCIEYAIGTFPDALHRYESGQTGGATFVVKVIDDNNFFSWIIVQFAGGDLVHGQIDGRHIINGKFYDPGAKISVKKSDIADWYLIYQNRPPEGNFIGKYMLLKLDDLASGDCDPSDAEFQHYRYFSMNYSFVPPGTDGWEMLGRTEDSDMSMQQKGHSPYELNTLFAISYMAPVVATSQEFVKLVRERGENTYRDDDRETLKKNEVGAYKKGKATCVRSHHVIDDKKALLDKSGKRGPMIREVASLYCINPKQTNMAVEVTYAHRYKPGNRDVDFIEKTNKIFESLAFSSRN